MLKAKCADEARLKWAAAGFLITIFVCTAMQVSPNYFVELKIAELEKSLDQSPQEAAREAAEKAAIAGASPSGKSKSAAKSKSGGKSSKGGTEGKSSRVKG
jgi:hypothetical protein